MGVKISESRWKECSPLRALFAAVLLLFSTSALSDPGANYFLVGGPAIVGGARAGFGGATGVFVSHGAPSSLSLGYAQLIGYTPRKNAVLYGETLAGYHLGYIGGFTGVGFRTTEKQSIVGQISYGVGLGPLVLTIRRYSENSKPYTEVALAFYWPLGLN